VPSARRISKEDDWRDAYALGRDCFLVAKKGSLYVMDGEGNSKKIYTLPQQLVRAGMQLHEPRPLRARKRERVIPSRLDLAEPTGKLVLADVYEGRNMEGVKRGEIKKLLVLETLAKPVNYTGKMIPMTFGGTFTLERVLGTVPVEEDGSAYFEVPALRTLFFVALDADDKSVKRMHSFLTVQPGETTSCVGCHEQRTKTIVKAKRRLMATGRAASRIEPIADVPDVFDFPRDIQPILDEHCVRCHDYDRRDGGVVLSGDRGPMYSHSFYALTVTAKQVSDGRDRLVTNLPPREVGTSASPLMDKLNGEHYDVRLSRREQDTIRYWIESGAVYPGTYAALGTGMIGDWPKSKLDTSDRAWAESKGAEEAIERRCIGCHDESLPVPKFLSDEMGFVLSNPDFDDVRCRMSRHLLFNLSRPKKSLILLGPLAKEAGGYGTCKQRLKGGKSGEAAAVFKDTEDADYRKILALCEAGKRHLDTIKRFDMPGFRPKPSYLREMKRYGILAMDVRVDAVIDVYAADQAYWESLWYRPGKIAGLIE
jgi:cytochrome c553